MSIRVVQYLPLFIDGDPIDTTVERLEEIMELEFVKRWSDYPRKVTQFERSDFCHIYAEVYNEHTDKVQHWTIAWVYHPMEEVKQVVEDYK
jgi:uncharacterized protein YlbG (UPF0298 family)